MSECERFKGRLRDLCEGRGRDGRLPVNPRDSLAFRHANGIMGLSEFQGKNQPAVQTEKVGSSFKELAQSLGLDDTTSGCGCGCNSLAREMNRLGVDGCRRERDRLIERLRENAGKVQWLRKALAVPLSVWTGLAFKVNPLDPLPGLFDEAVRRTEKQKKD